MNARKFIVDDWKSLTKKIESLNPLLKTVVMCGVFYKIDGIVDKIMFKVVDINKHPQLFDNNKGENK